jgi:hypothetical protein
VPDNQLDGIGGRDHGGQGTRLDPEALNRLLGHVPTTPSTPALVTDQRRDLAAAAKSRAGILTSNLRAVHL